MSPLTYPAAMRRFIAHIGAAKTGTTAFQGWLKAHRAEMMAAGYLVPEKTPQNGNHFNVAMALSGRSDAHGAAIRDATLREIDNHRELDVIVSAEALGSVEHMPTLLPALTERFHDFDRVAILSVRDQVAHYNSGFAQRRKAMRRKERDFDRYFLECLERGRGDWRARVEMYEEHGWRMFVIPYGKETKSKGITRTILSLPEFGDLAEHLSLDEPIERNPSMGAIGLIIMDLIQEAIDPEGVLDTVAPAALRDRVARIATERFDDQPFNGFTEAARQTLIDRFADRNRWTAERFFDVPWEVACPPQALAPLSPRGLSDLPSGKADRVVKIAERMTEHARELGGLERRRKSKPSADT